MKWMSGSTKRQCDRALKQPRLEIAMSKDSAAAAPADVEHAVHAFHADLVALRRLPGRADLPAVDVQAAVV